MASAYQIHQNYICFDRGPDLEKMDEIDPMRTNLMLSHQRQTMRPESTEPACEKSDQSGPMRTNPVLSRERWILCTKCAKPAFQDLGLDLVHHLIVAD